MRRRTSSVGLVALIAVVGVGLAAQAPKGPQEPSASFRSAITLVPVDVRVLDAQGRPVTDLKLGDFTILEDGVRQDIRHFSLQILTPEAPQTPADPALRRATAPPAASPDLVPQRGRVFLLVLGRGRLQYPSKGLDALLNFVRVKLLPQDRVAVMAYDRATDFTTNHDEVSQLIERLRASNDGIETALEFRFSGLAAVYGSTALPARLQAEITNIFKGTGNLASRPVVPAEMADAKGLAAINRRATDGAMDAALAKIQAQLLADTASFNPGQAAGEAAAAVGATPFLVGMESIANQALTDLPFEEFVARNAGTMQDLSKIYTGIAYMRFLEGEKHLAFFTENGLDILRGDDVDRLAEVANDARVVIDNFQTGGVMPGSGLSFALKDLRSLSGLTGGQASINEYTRDGLNRVDLATRASYLLGYYPAKPLGDGRYRKLVVKVNRPGLTVLYRHGYFGRPEQPAFDRRTFMTNTRIVSAALYKKEIQDIAVKLSVARIKGQGGVADELIVVARIDAGRIALKAADGKHVGVVEVAVFFANERKVVLQERSQTIDLQLPDASYQRVQREGIPYQMKMPVKDSVRFVKIVVYNYEQDTIGSAEVPVK